jgi:UDP-3-O-[3-hydroxymyristoyl] N-acetylglucosamine deacetylase / 3-hydroxyacyl-[acyl-carrier-protein] dehydratase
MKQKTIKKEISYSGIGLHTGDTTKVVFKPAKENSGIQFLRTDIPNSAPIKAIVEKVIGVTRGTTIGEGEVRVHTVEHIMAALSGLGIDNILIEVNASEPPVADGSSMPFIEVLQKAGIVEQNAEKTYLTITEPVEYSRDGVSLVILPADEFKINCTINYDHPVLGTQYLSLVINEENFINELAKSRTFCFDYEIETLKREGLAKGGNLNNAIVIGEKKIHNEGLRFNDEFVRHKILDLIGDLYLIGKPIKGHINAVKCGHSANIAFAKEIFKKSKEVPMHKVNNETNQQTAGEQIQGRVLDINAIRATIPHRYPFLFIDKVIITEDEKKAVGFKNLTMNEEFFQGHFPERPIMPGVIIVEALAQTACVLFLSKPGLSETKLAFFMGIDGFRFRRPVVPGDRLRLEVEVTRGRERGGKVSCKAYLDDKLAADGEIMFSLVDK